MGLLAVLEADRRAGRRVVDRAITPELFADNRLAEPIPDAADRGRRPRADRDPYDGEQVAELLAHRPPRLHVVGEPPGRGPEHRVEVPGLRKLEDAWMHPAVRVREHRHLAGVRSGLDHALAPGRVERPGLCDEDVAPGDERLDGEIVLERLGGTHHNAVKGPIGARLSDRGVLETRRNPDVRSSQTAPVRLGKAM